MLTSEGPDRSGMTHGHLAGGPFDIEVVVGVPIIDFIGPLESVFCPLASLAIEDFQKEGLSDAVLMVNDRDGFAVRRPREI